MSTKRTRWTEETADLKTKIYGRSAEMGKRVDNQLWCCIVLDGSFRGAEMSDSAAAAGRLNAFVDAAFAFAVTLVVTGAGGAASDNDSLQAVFREAPALLHAFALLAMFWYGHVRWRALGLGDGRSSFVLSLGLIFCVLVYVHPLRLISLSVNSLVGLGTPAGLDTLNTRDLFSLYGLVFFLLAGFIAALFWQSWRDPAGTDDSRATASGEFGVWAILACAGGLSLILAALTPLHFLAPWVYPLLGPAIGVFVWRHNGAHVASSAKAADKVVNRAANTSS